MDGWMFMFCQNETESFVQDDKFTVFFSHHIWLNYNPWIIYVQRCQTPSPLSFVNLPQLRHLMAYIKMLLCLTYNTSHYFGAVCSVRAEPLVARAQQMRSLSLSSCCRLLMTSLECCPRHNGWLWRTPRMQWHKLPTKPVPRASCQAAFPNGRLVVQFKGWELKWAWVLVRVPNPVTKPGGHLLEGRIYKFQQGAFHIPFLTYQFQISFLNQQSPHAIESTTVVHYNI